jgi:fructan beta-fructosidase
MHDEPNILPRPGFHLTPERNWMNDPNGLVFHRGRWHAFFQYNPEGSDWGNMSWGHATSVDLQHWDELPVALRFTAEEQVYSGSVVAAGPDGQLTAYYTSVSTDGRQAQSRATSDDDGLTWQRDPANPILDRGSQAFRDPKIIRYEDADGFRWIMLTVEAVERQVLVYSSTDLRTWEHVSTFGPVGPIGVVWECPDLIPLAVDGRPDETRWVLLLSTNPVGDEQDPDGSSMSYLVGDFDGTVFTPERSELRRLDHGRDFYAAVGFDSAPGGEAVILGWMGNWRYAADLPASPWRGAMSLPRRLSLTTVDDEPRLVQEPPAFVTERLTAIEPTTVAVSSEAVDLTLDGDGVVELHWDPSTAGELRLRLTADTGGEVVIVHDPTSATLAVTRSGGAMDTVHPDFASTSIVPLAGDGPARLLLSFDGPLLELFVDGGLATVSDLVLLGSGRPRLTLASERASPVTVAVAVLHRAAAVDRAAAVGQANACA